MDTGPVIASAVTRGETYHGPGDNGRAPRDAAPRYLADATAEGLVRFDAAGQIEPGLAERWIVIDDGMSYIFRLREAQWPDGTPVTAGQVVSALERALSPRSTNLLRPFLSSVSEVVVMTPQVIEVRLSRPRPDLLRLFAQPELGITRRGRAFAGAGPMRVAEAGRVPLLRPALDRNRAEPDSDDARPQPEDDVRLFRERTALAVARFAARRSDLVTGGSFADWPVVLAAEIAARETRIDPAAGLFGLAVIHREGILADAVGRAAVAGALDRAAATAAVAADWPTTDTILPEALDSARPPAVPGWAGIPFAARRAAARAIAAAAAGQPLRIALPAGPGATILFAHLRASLAAAGIAAERVGMADDGDLRLVDAVAPYDSARWYLATACVACSAEASAEIEAARLAPTLAERAQHVAAADTLMAEDVAFIPLARPYRWSLVARRLGQWSVNARAWHPLNRLREDAN